MSGKGQLRALDPWFDSKEVILELYSAGPAKEVADRWVNILREHVAPPYAFAVNGVWGGGKTTFLRFLYETLTDLQYATLWFNPWEYELQGNVVLALLRQLASKFESILGKSLEEVGILGLASTMATLDTAARLLGVSDWESLTKMVDKAELLVKGHRYKRYRDIVRETKAEFQDLTQKVHKRRKGKPLVVFLDDLDRCLPDNALSILGALKNLFVVDGAQVIFLCGIDTGVAKRFIKSRYPGMESDFAVNYFKKIFNHTIEVPRAISVNLEQCLVSYIQTLFGDSDCLTDERNAGGIAKSVLRLSNLAGNRSLRSVFNVVNQYYVTLFTAGRPLNAEKILPILFLREKWYGFYEKVAVEAKKFDSIGEEFRRVISAKSLAAAVAADPPLQDYLNNAAIDLSTTVAELNTLNLL